MGIDCTVISVPYLRLKDGRGRAGDGVLQVGDGDSGGGGLDDGAHSVVDDGLGGSGAARGLEGPAGEASGPKHVWVKSAIRTGEQKGWLGSSVLIANFQSI